MIFSLYLNSCESFQIALRSALTLFQHFAIGRCVPSPWASIILAKGNTSEGWERGGDELDCYQFVAAA
jgi:hypothetical protein